MSRSSSAVVDSKIVEMSFENSNFEKNASTSISTLQKLKEALRFDKSSDGFDRIGDSIKKVDFNSLTSGIETAKKGFNSLEAISFGYFSKIGGRIEETIHQYTSMFSTIKMAQDGFAEYETKMQSVQTILMGAKTAEGLPVTLDMVNQKLDELNTYADKTIYSFSDMTANIGKFTNAGVDLDTAVAAIQGVSNAAALSGSNAQQASHAMYNFAQALSSGYVKLIDWKSIENANMATVDFKQTLIDTALEIGTVTKEGEKYVSTTKDMNGKVSEAFDATSMFNESLSAQWMSTEVLTAALGKYADETTEIGKKAFQAATEVKTFSQLIDTLKEAMGSGWAQTWEIVVGDFEQSKELFTTLSNTFGGLIDSQAKARNALLKEGLGKPAVKITEDYITSLGMGTEQTEKLVNSLMEVGKANGVAFKSNDARGFFDSLSAGWLTMDTLKSKMEELNGTGIDSEGMTKSLDEINEAALRVIRGEFGNGMPKRIEQLNNEGFNGEKIQAYVDEIHKLAGGTWDVTDAIMEEARANVGLSESVDGASGEYDEFLKKLDASSYKKSGRELLFDALKTSIFSFKTILGSIKGALNEVFPPATGEKIYNIAKAINNASKALRRFALKNADNIRTVFLGIFKAFDLVLHVGKTLIGSVFKGITGFFKNMSSGSGGIGAFITKIAEAVSKFHDWVIENEIVEKGVKAVGDAINSVISTISGWIDAFKQLPEVQAVVEKFGNAFNYLRDNFPEILGKAKTSLSNFGTSVVDAFKYSKSPKEFFEGVRDAFSQLWTDISDSTIYQKITAGFKQIGESVKTFFNNLGTNADGSRNTFGKIIDALGNFKTRIQNLFKGLDENGKKIDIFAGIKEAFNHLWSDLSASGIKEKIQGALSTVWTTINDFFMTIGTNADGSLNTFGKVWTGLVEGFTWVTEKALAAKDAIVQFFTEHKLGKFFGDTFSDLSTGVLGFFGKIPNFVSGAVGKFKEFFGSIKDLGGFKVENFGKIFESFKKTVVSFFTNTDIFEPIATAFGNIKNRIVEKFKEFGIDLVGIKDKIVAFFVGIKEAFSNIQLPGFLNDIVEFFTGKKDEIVEGAESAGNGIAGFFEKVKNWISKVDVGTLKKIIAAFLLFKGFTFIKGLIKPVEQLLTAMASEKKAHANMMNKAAWLEVAASIGIMALVVAGLSKLDAGQIVGGIAAIGAMMTLMGLFNILTVKFVGKDAGEKLKSLGDMALKLSASIILLTIAIKLIGELVQRDPASMAIGVGGLIVLMGVLLAVTAIMSKFKGKKLMQGATGLLEIVGSLFGILVLIKLLSMMDFMTMIEGVGKLAILFALLAGMMFVMKKVVGDGLSVSIGIAGLAASIIAIAGALWILSTIDDIGKLYASVGALSLVMLALAVVVVAAKKVQTGAAVMFGLAATILALAAALAVLSLINPDDLVAPTIAMGVMLGLLAAIVALTGWLKPSILAMVGMAALVAIIGAVLFALATIPDPNAVLTVAEALAVALVAIGVVALICAGIGKLGPAAFLGVLVIAALMAAIVGVAALAVLLAGALSDSFAKLPEIGNNIADFMQNLSRLNDIGMVDIGPLAEALGSIFAASLVGGVDSLLSVVSEWQEGKTAAQTVADDMIAIVDAFDHFQTTMDRLDGIEIDTTPLDNAIKVVGKASFTGFGESLASIISHWEGEGTAVEMVSSDMEALATGFSKFAKIMDKFKDIEIDTSGINSVVESIDHISLVGFAESLASIVPEVQGKGTAVEMIASDMGALGDGFSKFAESTQKWQGITIDTTGINSLADSIKNISFTGLFEGIANLVLGDDEKTVVTQFADDMGVLAEALGEWQTQMAPIGSIDIPTDSINRIKDALDSIKEGGLLDSVLNFFGVDTAPDYTSFKEGAKQLGEALTEFSTSLGEGFDTGKLDTAIESIKKLSEVGVALGDIDFGGWFHDGVLTTFANELVEMVPNLNQFVDSFTNIESFTKVATAVTKISSAVSTLSTIKFGKGDLMNTDTINKIKQNITSIIEMFGQLKSADVSAVNKFTNALTKLNGTNISDAAKKVSTAGATKGAGKDTGKALSESVASGIDSAVIAKALMKAVKSAASGVDVSSYTKLGTKLGTQVSNGIKRTTETLKSTAKTVGTNFTSALANAITSTTAKVRTASSSMAKAASDAANNQRSQFETVGRNFVNGLANGIMSNASAAISAAARVATEALRAAKAALDIHSPSRETDKVGKFFDLGFANGIRRFGKNVYSESTGVASLAMQGLKEAIDFTSDLVMGDGTGGPVITPILDLSEIQNGASEIGSILGSTNPDVTLGNLRAISFNADTMRQQRTNNDLLRAIDSLGSTISNTSSGDTIIIDGITYDDGSNVSDAVRSLIRAVKVERRA